MMQESELAEEKAKRKAIGVFKIDLDNKKNEINLLEKKLNRKKKGKENHLEEKNELLECHNQMIDTNNNQLNKNVLLLENMRNMDE
jgi:hypothetical protein